jgi:hypothetical protein
MLKCFTSGCVRRRGSRQASLARHTVALATCFVLAMSAFSVCHAQGPSTEELAKASQNPVADLISVPFQ